MDEKDTACEEKKCTLLEHRLACAYLFLQTLVANIFLRLYVFPHLPGRSLIHLAIVVATRAIFSYASLWQYKTLTGRDLRRLNWWLHNVVEFLPAWLVDLTLGGCYYECTVRSLAKGYCAVGVMRR